MQLEFKKQFPDALNELARISDTAYISFNPDTHRLAGNGQETALVLMSDDPRFRNRQYYILEGDWRKQYAEAFEAGGLQACNELFNKLEPEHGSEWTSDTDALRVLQMLVNKLFEPKE